MHEIVVIADDFTGANDTGVQIAKKGVPVRVILDTEHIVADGASVVVDTESRVISGTAAYERVKDTIQAILRTGGCRIVYKKVDSTLRGHVVEEIRAAIDAYEPETIIFAPAYPAQGRSVQGQRLHVYDVPLLETEIAKDPRNPLNQDNIATILWDCGIEKARHYAIDQIENGHISIGTGAYTFDTLTKDHLRYIASAALKGSNKILWIGSAGLAEELLAEAYPPKPVLAVIGSISQKTMKQIAYCQYQGVSVIKVDMVRAYETKSIDADIASAVTQLGFGHDVILTGTTSRQDYEDFVSYGQTKALTSDDLAAFVKTMLSQAVLQIVEKTSVGGMFLTGGDTAIAAIKCMHAEGSQIEREILPGFVQGKLYGGPYAGMPIVTKAGAFGTEKDIFACIEAIKKS